MTKQYIVIFLLITVISSLALAISPANRQRKECLNKTVPKLLKYPLNSTYCHYMNLCDIPCNKDIVPPSDMELFDSSANYLNPKFGSSTDTNKNCLKPKSFLRSITSEACDSIEGCPNIRCVGKVKRGLNFGKRVFIAFEAFACVTSSLLMAVVTITNGGVTTPALVNPVLGGACKSFSSVSDFIDNIGQVFGFW